MTSPLKVLRVRVSGPTFSVGPQVAGSAAAARERFAEDGPGHVRMLGDGWVALWDDRTEEGKIIPRERVQYIEVAKADLVALFAEEDAEHALVNGVAGPAKAATAPEGKVALAAERGKGK